MVSNINCKRRKKCNRDFLNLLSNEIDSQLVYKNGVLDIDYILLFLIKHNIVRQSIVHRYVIIKSYPEYLERLGSKEKAVKEMAKDYPLEIKAIYSILANHYAYFHPNKIDF
jgi:hypothetical protein